MRRTWHRLVIIPHLRRSPPGGIRIFLTGLAGLILLSAFGMAAEGQSPEPVPDTVSIQSGTLTLRALLWKPSGPVPFPVVLFNHGSGPAELPLTRERLAIGPVFVRHGYAFLFLFSRGAGLSSSQDANSFDLINEALARGGVNERNRVQMQLLEKRELGDVTEALKFLRALPMIDDRRIAIAGHSFGGSLTLLMAERDTSVRAAIVFGGAAGSWDGSPQLRKRLRSAVASVRMPVFLAYAENDYSVAPARELSSELERARKPYRVKIYKAVGKTVAEGHDLLYKAVSSWEADVFAFLKEYMR